jgi:hypothetical protein
MTAIKARKFPQGSVCALMLAILVPNLGWSQEVNIGVGDYVRRNTPSPPPFPTSNDECKAYSDELSRFQREVSQKHETCLNTHPARCGRDPITGCSCVTCSEFHGAVSTADVNECYRAVRTADERIQRVNELLSSIDASYKKLLTRLKAKEAIDAITDGSPLAKDLGKISGFLHSSVAIGRSLEALRKDVKNGDNTSAITDSGNVSKELAVQGISRNPVALLMTDVAVNYVGRLTGDAMMTLDTMLREFAAGGNHAADAAGYSKYLKSIAEGADSNAAAAAQPGVAKLGPSGLPTRSATRIPESVLNSISPNSRSAYASLVVDSAYVAQHGGAQQALRAARTDFDEAEAITRQNEASGCRDRNGFRGQCGTGWYAQREVSRWLISVLQCWVSPTAAGC